MVLSRLHKGLTGQLVQLNALMHASPRYRLLVQGELPSQREGDKLLESAPEFLAPADKFVWGAWCDGRLLGCIEVLRRWPTRDCAYIGFLLVAEPFQRQGFGRQILALARQQVRTWPGVRRLRLAVTANNTPARAFWRHAGFRDTGQRDAQPGFIAPLIVLERPLV